MQGDERVRFCEQCALHVYNLSAMTASEAENLVLEKEGHLCVRFFQRNDGTVLTQDCPRGLAALGRAANHTAFLIRAVFVAMPVSLIFSLLWARSALATLAGQAAT